MSSVNFENQILDAIDTMVTNKVSNAGYNKTIRGVILSVEDYLTGKYKVKYQDSEIEAYSNNVDTRYSIGALVDILIPNGDFSLDKIILNVVDKGNAEYNTILEEDEQYEIEGGNAIAATQEFGLCSYHSNDVIYLYSRDNGINDINFDTLAFDEAIANNSQILCGAKFRTDFDAIQKRTGNFGLVYEIDFKDNITGTIITKKYKIDVNSMVGTPYDQTVPTRQYKIFKVNNENFDSVKNIYIFSDSFPIIKETKDINDIFVKDFELCAVRSLTYEEINGYNLTLTKEGKGYFNEVSSSDDVVTLKASLKSKNREITNNVNYYWFIEDNSITVDSEDYLTFGEEGWRCLNRYNKISDTEKMLLTNDNIFNISRELCGNIQTHIKCVAVRDNIAVANKVTTIYNYEPNHTITITSSQGTQFYFDNGNPNLICTIDGIENNSEYTYQWTSVDVNNLVANLEETTEDNEIYNAAVADYELLKAQIDTGRAMAAANEERLSELKAIIDSYEYKQRVEKNRIYSVDLTQIVEQTTFKCMVKREDTLIGIAEITLKNSLGVEGEYKLNIINGTQVFSYDFNGVSPASSSLENPIKIKPLAFEIIDNLGNKFNDLILSTCEVQWEVPQTETMLIGKNSTELAMTYQIADTFDYQKLNNNNIKLTVKYKNLILETHTSFTFTKDGDPGTNGTGVVCKIAPNTQDVIDGYPMLINGVPNFTPAATGKWFKVQLWENGEKIFEGTDSTGSYTVTWSVLRNTYMRSNNTTIKDPTNISVSGSTFSYSGYNADAASIVKVQVDYKDTTYYCTLPIIIAQVENDYDIELIENSGFRYVMYASDGKRPQYDNVRPFTIKTIKLINGYIEDISTIDNEYKVDYEWNIKGKIFNVTQDQFIDDLHLSIVNNSNLARNQKFLIPSEDFNGENVTNAVEVKILTANLTEIGRILIPIHFYLDKYGIASLNGWDGNRISINDETGSILAPQVGAGKKESDNTFTGVLIGSVKERKSDTTEEGLFGYYRGDRSIFLDAHTGKAQFGIAGSGQIILDPTQNKKGLIYGGNYVNGSSGMLIDLTTPEIKWGNGNFSVNRNGYLVARGGGSIAGWSIGDTTLSAAGITLNANGSISGDGQGGKTWSINRGLATFNNINATSGIIGAFTLDTAGIYSGQGSNQAGIGVYGSKYAFWAGSEDTGSAPFHVGHDGALSATGATISGNITATTLTATQGGSIGPWIFNNEAIYNGKGIGVSGSCGLGNISGWAFWAGNGAFRVTEGGEVNCSNIRVTGGGITGGYIHLAANGGWFRIGNGYTHPQVSGLNITGTGGLQITQAGAAMSGRCTANLGFSVNANRVGVGADGDEVHLLIARQGGGYYDVYVCGGIIYQATRVDS